MSLRRHLNKDGIAHANADSKIHSKHVRERRARRNVSWIAEVSEVETSPAVFKLQADDLNLGQGSYWTGFGETESTATGEDFQRHCNAVNWSRRWNYAIMKRKDKECLVRRKRSSEASEEFVVNLSPPQMSYLNAQLSRWKLGGISDNDRRDLLIGFANELRVAVVTEFAEKSARDVIASYVHWDSNKIHIGVINSRVDKDNNLIGEKYLGTLGPWCVGQNRLKKLGMVDEGDKRLEENLARFHERFDSQRMPLDLHLHDILDQRFDQLVNDSGDGGGGGLDLMRNAIAYYKGWKKASRLEAISRTPTASRVAWQTLRLVAPILPPPLRAALSVARTAKMALTVITTALESVSHPRGHMEALIDPPKQTIS